MTARPRHRYRCSNDRCDHGEPYRFTTLSPDQEGERCQFCKDGVFVREPTETVDTRGRT